MDGLTESSLSRLYQKHKDSDAGTISAFRGERTRKENLDLNKKLKWLLIGGGYSVTEIDGIWTENYGKPDQKEVKERSFIVFDRKQSGKLKDDLIKFGRMFDQEAITYWNRKSGNYVVIGTNKNGFLGDGGIKQLSTPMFGQDGKMYSKISGRPFIFSECVSGEFAFDDDLLKHSIYVRQFMENEYERTQREKYD